MTACTKFFEQTHACRHGKAAELPFFFFSLFLSFVFISFLSTFYCARVDIIFIFIFYVVLCFISSNIFLH